MSDRTRMTAKTRSVGLLAGALSAVLVAALVSLFWSEMQEAPVMDERAHQATDRVRSASRGEADSAKRVIAGLPLVGPGPAMSLGTPRIAGRIVREQGGAPVAGVEVSALIGTRAADERKPFSDQFARRKEERDGTLLGRTSTGADGTFVFALTDLQGEPDYLVARYGVYVPNEDEDFFIAENSKWQSPMFGQRIDLAGINGARDDLLIRMDIGWDLHGVVMRTDGAPVRSARLKTVVDGRWRRTSWSAEDGTFRLRGLPPTTLPVEVVISEPLLKTRITEVQPPSNDEWEVELSVVLEQLGVN